jgi:hypothetical protein
MKKNNLITSREKDNESLTPAELMKKHNANSEHIISDNEMRNLKIGDNAEDDTELKNEIEEKEAEDNCHHHENNTYDLLGT